MDSSRTKLHSHSIEILILKILHQPPPKITFKNWKHVDNLTFTDRVMIKTEENSILHQIRFSQDRSRPTFALVIHILCKIYLMLHEKSYFTKRELFYQEIQIVRSQRILDQVLLIICNLLECPPWELGIIATSKGLVAGPLLIKADGEHVINCVSPGGTLIPHVICFPNIELRSSARYVLLIEKDATFQRLLNENILDELSDTLLVTGKGFPDINTRILINKLNRNLKIPVLALVDADPFGIAIMCVYRFGSQNLSSYSENLVTPEIKWIGVHPSDILTNDIISLPLEESDLMKLKILSDKIFIKLHKKILKEIQILLQHKKKAEIEAICDYCDNYLIRTYIPSKIMRNELY